MITPKEITERFYKVLAKKKGEYGRGFNKFLCLETGLSSGFISQVVRGLQTPSPETQEMILKALNVDYQSILQVNSPSANVMEFKTSTEKKHFEIIKQFEDPETALLFNSFLVRLEKLDVKKYEDIFGDVRGHVRELERKLAEEAEKEGVDDIPRKTANDGP